MHKLIRISFKTKLPKSMKYCPNDENDRFKIVFLDLKKSKIKKVNYSL